ncbi:uncharacterized protein LOC108743618 isoform X2 [Agrilus planipennis]|uniref:Uncharacterized protein LOC108743618 isoform X2 n=1 Tax=Agrilus planipennis TaxID=224129 RepID=A0A1W4XFC2_AGRPL|nr:uncharacterized protein LOC108743618 isoform X2 [Agrilus planipennis]
MGLQFIGMLMHRFTIFCQILSNTSVRIGRFQKSKNKQTDEVLLEKDPVRMVKKLIQLRDVKKEKDIERRNTSIERVKDGVKSDEATTTDLTHAFSRRR